MSKIEIKSTFMLPLISIPEVVKHYAPHFESAFTQADYKHFQRYISGLIVSENKTIEGINRLFVLEPRNQSTLNRFLTASKYDVSNLHRLRLELLNSQEQTRLKGEGHAGGVVSLDDTMLMHYGKCFDQIAYLKDHATDSYMWAHNLVNLHYSDDKTDYPLSFELWKPMNVETVATAIQDAGYLIKSSKKELKQTAPKKWKQHLRYLYKKHCGDERVRSSYRSKLTIGQDLLRDFYRAHPLDIPVAFDKWFTNPAFCRYIDEDLEKGYVGGLKSSEKILRAGGKTISVGDFVKSLHEEHLTQSPEEEPRKQPVFGKVTIRYKGKKEVYYNYCKVHHICGYGRQRLLISYSNPELTGTARVFISNRLKWRSHQMARVGRHRWPVEEYHKEGKAEGLNKYQTRNFKAIEKHIAMVAVVYSILQHSRHDSVLLNNLREQLDIKNIEGSLAFWRRAAQAQALWLLVQWLKVSIQEGMSLQQIVQTLIPAYGLS